MFYLRVLSFLLFSCMLTPPAFGTIHPKIAKHFENYEKASTKLSYSPNSFFRKLAFKSAQSNLRSSLKSFAKHTQNEAAWKAINSCEISKYILDMELLIKAPSNLTLSNGLCETFVAALAFYCPQLKSLTLNLEGIGNLPPQIGSLAELQHLQVRGNMIRVMPPAIQKLAGLMSLKLSGTSLETLPKEIGELKNLRSLIIEQSLLKSLPEEIGGLENLAEFVIEQSPLNELPRTIGSLRNLETLRVSGTAIGTLPFEFAQLQSLHSLYLGGNKFKYFPEVITQLVRLKILAISMNHIEFIPPTIGLMTGLTSLVAFQNELSSLPSELSLIPELNEIDASYNKIQGLPRALFSGRFRKFALQGNQFLTSKDTARSIVVDPFVLNYAIERSLNISPDALRGDAYNQFFLTYLPQFRPGLVYSIEGDHPIVHMEIENDSSLRFTPAQVDEVLRLYNQGTPIYLSSLL